MFMIADEEPRTNLLSNVLERMSQNQYANEINVKYLKRDVTAEQKFVEAAKHFNCQFTFKADVNRTLASDLLTAICLGTEQPNLTDDHLNDGIKLVRPLRNLSKLEKDLYLKARSLKSLQSRYYGENKGTNGSLQNLTKSFIQNLQTSFSSTFSRGVIYASSGSTPSQQLVDADLKDKPIESTKRLASDADRGDRRTNCTRIACEIIKNFVRKCLLSGDIGDIAVFMTLSPTIFH
uniref:Uncharacterized protein n=1 Tax=Glossina palpalis gambiensis TaxID=67801 RepID=A0A1B0BWR1_9MUSC